jgi:hypothetical protein
MIKIRIIGIIAITFIAIAAMFFAGCATIPISLKPPTIQETAQTVGYAIAVKNPDLVKELIKHTTVGKEDVLVLYPNWKRYLSYRLSKEDFLVVQALLTLVDRSLVLESRDAQEAIIRGLFLAFISGLEAGIKDKP